MRLLRLAPLLLALGAALPASAAPSATRQAEAGEYFPPKAIAQADLNAAILDAARTGRTLLVVFGADWCHDSRALARALTSERFRSEFAADYAVVLIDVGKPQTGQGRNLELLLRFGVKRLNSTPAMFALGTDLRLRNSRRDALSWRNADRRGEDAVYAWLRKL